MVVKGASLVNKAELQERVATINAEIFQLKSNYAKLEGHLAEAQHWLSELIKSEEEIKNESSEDLGEING